MGIQEKLQNLPTSPGVYLMKNARGQVIYIGKAKVLADRVRSYFQRSSALSPRIQAMIQQAADLDIFVTRSELEALILENNLVKKHRPRYNVVLRDDKNYPFLRLPLDDDYPRLEIVRRVKPDGALYYGPYVPTHALRETLRLLRKIFPLPNCHILIDGTTERACIEYEIKRCLAPCTGQQSKDDYQAMMRQVRLFLEGKDSELLKSLRSRMEIESARLNFEEAARLRDQIANIQRVLEKQRITSTELVDQDVIALAREESTVDLQILFVRGGMLVGRKDFFWPDIGGTSEEELVTSFIQQFYDQEVLVPKEILLPLKVQETELEVLESWLTKRKGERVYLRTPMRGKDSHLIGLAKENAGLALSGHLQEQKAKAAEAVLLQELLGLRKIPQRIECFDISNIGGDQSVGSMVVWEGKRSKKSDYRHFKIRRVQGANDFAMLQEIVSRHYERVKSEGRILPDLIVIDGGKGQLSAVQEVLQGLELSQIDLIGLAKARGEKEERVFLPGHSESIPLSPTSPATHLLQRIRDESHRFAITYHRKLRGKEMTASVLNEVPGIGEARKRALLIRFGGLEGIKSASLEELCAVPQMNEKLAGTLYRALHQ
jgi:excinuclease ABC subunit C